MLAKKYVRKFNSETFKKENKIKGTFKQMELGNNRLVLLSEKEKDTMQEEVTMYTLGKLEKQYSYKI